MKKTNGIVIVLIVIFAIVVMLFTTLGWGGNILKEPATVANFEECIAAGFPVAESYPRQCRAPDGKMFAEDIGNELEKSDLIRVSYPRPNARIVSPVFIEGEARGYWYFEASFPIKVLDANGTELGVGIARALGEWMTEDFVPFKTTIAYSKPQTDTGTIVLQKDNPSGLPENDDELRIPIRFVRTGSPSTGSGSSSGGGAVATKECVVSGCSGQICAEEEMVSTCEYRPEYTCYKTASCERQQDGSCGWTQTAVLTFCLQASVLTKGNAQVE